MPGILGIVRQRPWNDPREAAAALKRMAQPIRYVPAQTLDCFVEARWAAAVVDHGHGFGFLKPAAVRREGVLLLIDGEVFPDGSDVPGECSSVHPTIQRAAFCLHLYLAEGPSFARRLNGAFGIAVVDTREDRIRLYTDRFGAHWLFVWQKHDEAAFASSVRSLLAYRRDIGRQYDRQAVAELVVFERVLGRRTLFTDITRVPAGCEAVWDGAAWSVRPYMTSGEPESNGPIVDWRDAAAELACRLRRAVGKRTADGARTAILLSGGIDSRLVAASCDPAVIAATLADRATRVSRETRLASATAQALGLRHVLLARDPQYYARIAAQATEINEGLCTFVGCHSLGVHDPLSDTGVKVVLTGDRSDVMFKDYFAPSVLPRGLYADGPLAVRARAAARLLADGPIVRRVDRQDLLMLILNDSMKSVAAAAREEMIEFLARRISALGDLSRAVSECALADWQGLTAMGFGRGLRTRFVDRTPFFDNSLWELARAIPMGWRLRGRVVRRALGLASRRVSRIADANTGLPACLCPPWDRLVGELRAAARGVGRLARKRRGFVRALLGPESGCRVFTEGSWHDRNGALRLCREYRELVEWAIEHLREDFFDVRMARTLLAEDLTAEIPRLNHLFEIVITFAVFDSRWGVLRTGAEHDEV